MEIQLFPLGPIPAVVQRLVHTTYNCGIPFRLGTAGPYSRVMELEDMSVLETDAQRRESSKLSSRTKSLYKLISAQ